MAAPSNLKVGDTLYRVSREKAGNTTASRDRVDEYTVVNIEQGQFGPRVTLKGYRAEFVRVSALRNSPPEWVKSEAFSPRRCHFCRAQEGTTGHRDACRHPAAVKARKAAAPKEGST